MTAIATGGDTSKAASDAQAAAQAAADSAAAAATNASNAATEAGRSADSAAAAQQSAAAAQTAAENAANASDAGTASNISTGPQTQEAFDNRLAARARVYAAGVKGDDATDDYSAIQAAVDAAITRGISVVQLPDGAVCRVSQTIELSSPTITTPRRSSVRLLGPATIKPTVNFTGTEVVRHTQTAAQASAGSFGYGTGLDDIEIDGTLCTSTVVDGVRLDGCAEPILRVNVHNMSGHGWTAPADDTIDANGDDSYAVIDPLVDACRFQDNGGRGIFQTRFAATFTAHNTYVTGNGQGGIQITAPKVQFIGGAVAYNGGDSGVRLTKATSAGTPTASGVKFVAVELDRNAGTNAWFENVYNAEFEKCRWINAETGAAFDGGSMIAASMAKFGGTAGMSATDVKITDPYVRHSQQTTNPAFTLWDFTSSSSGCRVLDMHELAGGSSNRIIATQTGTWNKVTAVGAVPLVTTSLTPQAAYAQAYRSAAFTVSTALADLPFDVESLDSGSRYDPTTGIYACDNDLGVYDVIGFVTVDGTAITTTDRRIDVHLRLDPGTGTYSTIRLAPVPVRASSYDTVIPFTFRLGITAANSNIKLAVVATTATALKISSQASQLTITKVG